MGIIISHLLVSFWHFWEHCLLRSKQSWPTSFSSNSHPLPSHSRQILQLIYYATMLLINRLHHLPFSLAYYLSWIAIPPRHFLLLPCRNCPLVPYIFYIFYLPWRSFRLRSWRISRASWAGCSSIFFILLLHQYFRRVLRWISGYGWRPTVSWHSFWMWSVSMPIVESVRWRWV